ncbi:hypothetical protein CSHISOI_00315 [Colletotrichum shisoi]|uniref:Uncharacterized protein n=1 Tax=Colletotrichum shisoi TaxID=2078593 RepID=A0A5Q4C706_9PEZI|nr:hypothetical protein CSHISOI_00315 [Colletotrichum shisoi]
MSEFSVVHAEFMEAFEEEERTAASATVTAARHGVSLAQSMRESWESGGVWFWHSIMSTNAMFSLFTHHICPRFLANRLLFKEEKLISSFWSEDADKTVEGKVQEYERYKEKLESLFKLESR